MTIDEKDMTIDEKELRRCANEITKKFALSGMLLVAQDAQDSKEVYILELSEIDKHLLLQISVSMFEKAMSLFAKSHEQKNTADQSSPGSN